VHAMAAKADPNIFGERVFVLRKSKGWSQPQLAKRVGTSAAIIGRYERGAAVPSVEVAKRIAEALDVTLDYLVTDDSGPNLFQDRAAYERCKALATLPEEDRGHIHRVIDAFIRDAKARLTYGR